jgi:hypothetical protein
LQKQFISSKKLFVSTKTIYFIDPAHAGMTKTVYFINPAHAGMAKTVYFINPAHAGLAKDDCKRITATAMF